MGSSNTAGKDDSTANATAAANAGGSGSSNDGLPDSKPSLYIEGEKVLAYHGPRIYEAKIQKAEFRKKEWRYFVHYLGWNKNWDEWVGMDRLMKITEENLQKQQALEKKQGVDKHHKSGRSSHSRPKGSTDTKVDKEDVKNNVAKGKKRKSDEKDISSEKLVKIQIPSTLKRQLVDDWEFVTQKDKLVKLPRSPNVDDLLKKYLEYRTRKDGTITDSVAEILNGLRCYFDKALPLMLLYKKERQQYQEAVTNNASPSTVYGAEHLLRLFVKFPELLAFINIEEETLTRLQQKLVDFLRYLQKNQNSFFLSVYDGSRVAEGAAKGKEN